MSLSKLLQQGLRVALDGPTLRVMVGHTAGAALAGVAKPVYEVLYSHFSFNGNELGVVLQDSFVRGLSAVDDELNGWRISKALHSKLNREYHARIREHYFLPFAAGQKP